MATAAFGGSPTLAPEPTPTPTPAPGIVGGATFGAPLDPNWQSEMTTTGVSALGGPISVPNAGYTQQQLTPDQPGMYSAQLEAEAAARAAGAPAQTINYSGSFGGGTGNVTPAPTSAPTAAPVQSQPPAGTPTQSGTPAGIPVGSPSGDSWSKLDQIDWSPKNTAIATQQLYDAMIANNWTLDQVGAKYGWTGPELAGHFKRYNVGGNLGGIVNGAAQMGDPTKWNVTDDQTVEGRINRIIGQDSAMNQTARTNALQEANARGLGNSALAVSAGEQAVINSAMPIAQADAATFAKAAGYNADESNQFEAKNVDAQNQFLGADKQIAGQKELTGMQIAGQKDIATLNSDTQKFIAQMDVNAKTAADKLAQDNQILLQTNGNAAQAFNTAMSAINNIQNNDKMDAATKTRAMANVWHDVQNQLKVLGTVASLNLQQDLTFAGQPGFDAQGNWVGFTDEAGAVTNTPLAPGETRAPTPAPTPAPGGIVSGGNDVGAGPAGTF